jgi:hypothetical protein
VAEESLANPGEAAQLARLMCGLDVPAQEGFASNVVPVPGGGCLAVLRGEGRAPQSVVWLGAAGAKPHPLLQLPSDAVVDVVSPLPDGGARVTFLDAALVLHGRELSATGAVMRTLRLGKVSSSSMHGLGMIEYLGPWSNSPTVRLRAWGGAPGARFRVPELAGPMSVDDRATRLAAPLADGSVVVFDAAGGRVAKFPAREVTAVRLDGDGCGLLTVSSEAIKRWAVPCAPQAR